MEFKGLIVAIFLSALFASISISIGNDAIQSNVLTNDNNSSKDINESRFYIDRSDFETHLIRHIPAPQEYKNELPPVGVTEIIYNSEDLTLKAWLSDNPKDGKKHPAIVYEHGGFSFGGSDWEDAQEFLNQGFVLMTPTLRGEYGNPGNFEFFYGEVNDLIAAGDYLANVSYVDKDRIFLCGHSVGGTLSMLTSMMPSKYRAIASFGGSPDQESFFRNIGMVIPFARNTKEIELRSPIIYSDSIIKPLFVYVGDQDGYLYFSRDFVKRARENGSPCELSVIKGDHFSSVGESIRQSINEFKNIQSYEATELNRSIAYNFTLMGHALSGLHKYEESIGYYNKAIEIDSENSEALRGKGADLVELGLYEEAIDSLDKAIKIDPYNADQWKNEGIALDKLGRYQDAIKCFDIAIKIDPQNAEIWYEEGNALMGLKRFVKASFSYDKAIGLNQQYAESWYGKGLALYNLGRYDEAINCNDRAIAINPRYAMVWNNKGLALNSMGKYDEALACYEKAIEIDNKLALAWNNKGYALKLLGKIPESNAAFAKAKEMGYKG